MFGLFRRKERTCHKQECVHEYVLVDYDSRVDWAMDTVEWFTLSCRKCNKVKVVDPFNYGRMKGYGLIFEREEVSNEREGLYNV